jgi:hypothetical protein
MSSSCLNFSVSIRSPGPVEPQDVTCEGFGDLTYTRIASSRFRLSSFSVPINTTSTNSALHKSLLPQDDLDERVDQAVDTFLRSLSQIGPELLSVRAYDIIILFVH